MKRNIYIRIAAGCMFIHTIGHCFGTFASKAPNATIARVQQEMQENSFAFMGRQASLGIFFEGYAVACICFLLFSAIVLWWLATQTETPLGARLLRLGFFYLAALSVVEILYRFPFYFTVVAALCLLVALVQRPSTSPSFFSSPANPGPRS